MKRAVLALALVVVLAEIAEEVERRLLELEQVLIDECLFAVLSPTEKEDVDLVHLHTGRAAWLGALAR